MDKKTGTATAQQLDERVQDRLEAVLDGMPVAVSWANLRSGEILFVNRKFRQMFGYELGDHSTVEDWIQRAYPDPEQVKRAMRMWAPHFETTAIVPFEISQVEVDVTCKDGSVKTTLLSGMILPHEGWALAIFSDITDRKVAEERVQQQALEDPLTGLCNRRAFEETLKPILNRARESREIVALLVLDLDEFKPLNDTMGHDHGDRILQIVSERIRRGVRSDDVVCRLGGDEFCVIMETPGAVHVAEEVADRILSEVGQPTTVDGQTHTLTMSIGIGCFPEEASDEDQLYKTADQALYRAKEQGGGRWSR